MKMIMTWIFIHVITPMFRAEIDKVVQTEYNAGTKDAYDSIVHDTAFYTKFADQATQYDRPTDVSLCIWQSIYTAGKLSNVRK